MYALNPLLHICKKKSYFHTNTESYLIFELDSIKIIYIPLLQIKKNYYCLGKNDK